MPDPLPIEPLPPGTDPDSLIFLTRLVAVEFNAGSTGAYASDRGALRSVWQPLAGTGALWCGIDYASATDVDAAYHPGVTETFTVLFVHPIAAQFDRRYRLIELDTATLLPLVPARTLLVTGQPDDAAGTGHHWIVRAIEQEF